MFDYPLAEARVNRKLVTALVMPQNREVAGPAVRLHLGRPGLPEARYRDGPGLQVDREPEPSTLTRPSTGCRGQQVTDSACGRSRRGTARHRVTIGPLGMIM
jgi:hypothetical protein